MIIQLTMIISRIYRFHQSQLLNLTLSHDYILFINIHFCHYTPVRTEILKMISSHHLKDKVDPVTYS